MSPQVIRKLAFLLIILLIQFFILVTYVVNTSALNNAINDTQIQLANQVLKQQDNRNKIHNKIKEKLQTQNQDSSFQRVKPTEIKRITQMQLPKEETTVEIIESDKVNPGLNVR